MEVKEGLLQQLSESSSMIKNLIFDFGKVLVDYDFEAFFRKYIPDTERCRAFTPVLYNEELQQLLDREERPFEFIMEEWIEKNKEFEPEIRYFNEHYPEIVTNEVEGMYDLLTRLKANGYKLYGLTNWCSKVYLTMAQFPIFKLLDGQIISSEEHVIKPEPEIYQRLFTKFNLKPEECIFADDRTENIEGGRQSGMDGIVFKDAKQYERELREYIAINQDTIETECLLLRRWKLSDADALYKYACDPEVGPHAGWPPHKNIEESRMIIREVFTNDYTWAVVLKETNEPIGCMGYYPFGKSNIEIGKNDAEVGYWIGKPHWNEGYCTEALQAMIRYCYEKKNFQTLWADFFIDNPASGRVMEKCGFTDTGKENYCSNLYHGENRPVHIMKLEKNQ